MICFLFLLFFSLLPLFCIWKEMQMQHKVTRQWFEYDWMSLKTITCTWLHVSAIHDTSPDFCPVPRRQLPEIEDIWKNIVRIKTYFCVTFFVFIMTIYFFFFLECDIICSHHCGLSLHCYIPFLSKIINNLNPNGHFNFKNINNGWVKMAPFIMSKTQH